MLASLLPQRTKANSRGTSKNDRAARGLPKYPFVRRRQMDNTAISSSSRLNVAETGEDDTIDISATASTLNKIVFEPEPDDWFPQELLQRALTDDDESVYSGSGAALVDFNRKQHPHVDVNSSSGTVYQSMSLTVSERWTRRASEMSVMSGATVARALIGGVYTLPGEPKESTSLQRHPSSLLTRTDSFVLPRGSHSGSPVYLADHAPPLPEGAKHSYIPPRAARFPHHSRESTSAVEQTNPDTIPATISAVRSTDNVPRWSGRQRPLSDTELPRKSARARVGSRVMSVTLEKPLPDFPSQDLGMSFDIAAFSPSNIVFSAKGVVPSPRLATPSPSIISEAPADVTKDVSAKVLQTHARDITSRKRIIRLPIGSTSISLSAGPSQRDEISPQRAHTRSASATDSVISSDVGPSIVSPAPASSSSRESGLIPPRNTPSPIQVTQDADDPTSYILTINPHLNTPLPPPTPMFQQVFPETPRLFTPGLTPALPTGFAVSSNPPLPARATPRGRMLPSLAQKACNQALGSSKEVAIARHIPRRSVSQCYAINYDQSVSGDAAGIQRHNSSSSVPSSLNNGLSPAELVREAYRANRRSFTLPVPSDQSHASHLPSALPSIYYEVFKTSERSPTAATPEEMESVTQQFISHAFEASASSDTLPSPRYQTSPQIRHSFQHPRYSSELAASPSSLSPTHVTNDGAVSPSTAVLPMPAVSATRASRALPSPVQTPQRWDESLDPPPSYSDAMSAANPVSSGHTLSPATASAVPSTMPPDEPRTIPVRRRISRIPRRPLGPRNRLDPHRAGSSNTPSASTPPPLMSLPSAEESGEQSRLSASSFSTYLSIVARDPPVKFEVPPPPWRPYTMKAAFWMFSSAELQAIVSQAIKQSAHGSSIRLLPLEALNDDLPAEMHRLEIQEADIKAHYIEQARKRRQLLVALYASSVQDRQMECRARFVTIVDELMTVSATLDELTQDLYSVDAQISKIKLLQERHSASALSIALRKLNKSLARQQAQTDELCRRVEALEAERDDAWREAETIANQYDTMNEQNEPCSATVTRQSDRVVAARKGSIRRAGLRSARVSRRSSSSSVQSVVAGTTEPPPVPRIPRRQVVSSDEIRFKAGSASV
ncbi:hypothetical protein FISHEDRAFT_72404 [Fistulina hepatica ATCC 64428]|uniref:Uncharacterized protein n=1 Tax=Fistulina hepatica ATCC 64428 TaxID=1128425 RepID=A0A0D7AG16_9AGAR|nr:hypothetical protein FISHEDRAFT_72404 [Fistulina hepatica ATCC 64428]